MLTEAEAADVVFDMLDVKKDESEALRRIRHYWRGRQEHPSLPANTPAQITQFAEMSRVNLIGLVVDILAQSLAIDGFRADDSAADAPVWAAFQANHLDARQGGIYRAGLAYGVSYLTITPAEVLPGSDAAEVVMRGVSPLRMTTLYGNDPEWPEFGLETRRDGTWRLFDDEAIYTFEPGPDITEEEKLAGVVKRKPTLVEDPEPHSFPATPVVRFRNTEDLDEDFDGEVEGLIPLQDQADVTTFGLLVAQHFQSFRQRYVIGWTSADENTKARAAASRLWTFDDENVKVGEFGQVDLGGYIRSRESITELLGTISQTPAHDLLGKMVNLAAEALAAAEKGQRRKIADRQTSFGESWEQAFWLIDPGSAGQVRWKDTEARSLSQTVDALGKMATLLGVPIELLWERLPNFSQQDVERAKAILAEGDTLSKLAGILDEQAGGEPPPPDEGEPVDQ